VNGRCFIGGYSCVDRCKKYFRRKRSSSKPVTQPKATQKRSVFGRLFTSSAPPKKKVSQYGGLGCATYGTYGLFRHGHPCCPRTVECTSCPSNFAFVMRSHARGSGECVAYERSPSVWCTDMDKDSYVTDLAKTNDKICTKVSLETNDMRISGSKKPGYKRELYKRMKGRQGMKGAYNSKARAYCQVRKETYCRSNRCYVRKQVKCLKVCSVGTKKELRCFKAACKGKHGHIPCLNVALTA